MTGMFEHVAKAIFFQGREQDDTMWEHMQPHLRETARAQARAAIDAIFRDSRFTEFGGKTIVTNRAFPTNYWDGQELREVIVGFDLAAPTQDDDKSKAWREMKRWLQDRDA